MNIFKFLFSLRNIFELKPKCSLGGDVNSDLRFWGNSEGPSKYNPKTGLVERIPKPKWYQLVATERKLKKLSLDQYEKRMRSGELPCHSKIFQKKMIKFSNK